MPRKNVLMIHPYQTQGKIWQAILKSQQLAVIWEADDFPLIEAIGSLKDSNLEIPDLFLLDLDIKAINPYAFCRWYRQQFPEGKVILTSSDRAEIADAERRWAIGQGAQDLLPGFRQDSLLTTAVVGVNKVLEVLDALPLNQQDLIRTLYHLTASKKLQAPILSVPSATSQSTNAAESTHPPPSPAREAKSLDPQPKRVYRGVAY